MNILTWSLLSSHYNKHKITFGVTQDEVWQAPALFYGPTWLLILRNILYWCVSASDYIQPAFFFFYTNYRMKEVARVSWIHFFWAAETRNSETDSSVSKCVKHLENWNLLGQQSRARLSKCKQNEFNQYHIWFPDTCRNPHIYITHRQTDISAQHKCSSNDCGL